MSPLKGFYQPKSSFTVLLILQVCQSLSFSLFVSVCMNVCVCVCVCVSVCEYMRVAVGNGAPAPPDVHFNHFKVLFYEC